ncbi:MAG: hypothetical protein HZA61_07255 [Candidatus Eisenbacteria bacterium]|uniref:PilY1 beta-propeller domain-containing protein n=1 Tax=Eiseniibacteriota bacterium TaxID=2212470 RepID=A0A933SG13_UNCEI|nr:hypothetical protein [Candidatus Eisenbacteria bacterium]
MRKNAKMQVWGLVLAALASMHATIAGAVCDVPLVISTGGGEANVMILLDNSGSMNEVVWHSAYNPNTNYSGNFDRTQTYSISSDGTYSPRSFNRRWATTPTAYLVNSDGGYDGDYPGNYLNWIFYNATTAQRAAIPTVTRIQAAKAAVNAVFASSSSVRFGMYKFNGGTGGTKVADVGTPIATIQANMAGINADSWTPLAETMVNILDYYKTTGAGAPIVASCQRSFVVIVSDGHPTQDLDVPAYLRDYDGDGLDPGNCTSLGAPFGNSYNCSHYLDDVATYMYRNDLRPDMDGMQNVATFVIGFGINAPILQLTADKGGGDYYSVNSVEGLGAALTAAFSTIETRISSGAAVSVVSAEDRTSNRLFRARYESQTWRGFVESFELPYHAGSQPLWEAGSQLASRATSSRSIFTSTTGTDSYTFTATNAATLRTLLGAADNTEAANIINFTRGDSIAGYRSRNGWRLGDIVDSAPIMVGKPTGFTSLNNYAAFRSANANRTEALYLGANDGMLHCFNAADGSEMWGYVPKLMLPRLRELTSPTYCHAYYVNLSPMAFDVYTSNAWRTMLVGGYERGGSGLFALDVTSPEHPSVLWDVSIPALNNSWNVPTLIRDRTLNKHLLLVGTGLVGGSAQTNLLAVDPASGSVVTTLALGSPVTYNKTTRATSIDVNFDGYDDLAYLGDLKGRLWRVNLQANPWTVSLLFDCGKPIQAAPAVTMDAVGRPMVFFGTGQYLSVSDVATTTQQTIYAVTDWGTGATVSTSDLADQTTTLHSITSTQKGWYVNMVEHSGERVTRAPALIAGTLYVPSFLPNTDACAGGGQSWLYSLDYNDGSAPDHATETENNVLTGRVQSMGDGILADPSVDLVNEALVLQSSNAVLLTHQINTGLRKMAVRSWRQMFR